MSKIKIEQDDDAYFELAFNINLNMKMSERAFTEP